MRYRSSSRSPAEKRSPREAGPPAARLIPAVPDPGQPGDGVPDLGGGEAGVRGDGRGAVPVGDSASAPSTAPQRGQKRCVSDTVSEHDGQCRTEDTVT